MGEPAEAPAASSRRVEGDEEMEAFYSQEDHRKAYEIEIEFPTSKRGLKKFVANPEAYVARKSRSVKWR